MTKYEKNSKILKYLMMLLTKWGRYWREFHPLRKGSAMSKNHIYTAFPLKAPPILPRALNICWHLVFVYLPRQVCAVPCLVAQVCPTLYDPMYCSLLGSSVHEILQARILEWVAMPSFSESSQPRDQTQVSHIAGDFFTNWATREALDKFRLYYCQEKLLTLIGSIVF